MTRYEAHIEKDWREHGLAHLLVARIRDDGSADVGVFLVDVFCLGVKDALLETDVPASELEDFIATNLPEASRERIHPTCAKKLIDGALAYAEGLGFAAHRDYRKARRVLSGLDAALCPTGFTFGANGRPCYVQGPNDTPERIERVLAILEARCGPDGFDYELADMPAAEDDAEDARSALGMFFDDEPEGGPSFYEFSGILTAMLICPTAISPAKVPELLWGSAGRAWEGQDELADFLDDLRVYWNSLANLIALSVASPPGTIQNPAPDPIDIYQEDFEAAEHMVPALILWTRGFLRVTEAWPEAWGNAISRADLAPHWTVLRAWSNPDQPGNLAILEGGDTGSGSNIRSTLPNAVTALARALRPPGAEPG